MVSLVKVAYAVDESKYFDNVTMNLELRADNLNSFSKVNNFKLSILANIAMSVLFLGLMYFAFPILRNTAFVIFSKVNRKDS